MKIETIKFYNYSLFVRIKYTIHTFQSELKTEEISKIYFDRNDSIDEYEMISNMNDESITKEYIEKIIDSIEKPFAFNKKDNDIVFAIQYAYVDEWGFSRWFDFPSMEKWLEILNNRF